MYFASLAAYIQKLYLEHLEHQKQERYRYYFKRSHAENNPSEVLSMIIDGADQARYRLPHFAEKVSLPTTHTQASS